MEPSRNCLCDFDSCLPHAMPAVLDLNQLCPAAGSVEHCALLDLPDNVEFVTFSVVIMENIPIWTGSIWSALHLLRLKFRMPRPVCC